MQRMVVTLTVFMWGVALSSTGQAQVLSPRIAPLAEDQWTVNVRSGISGFGVTAQSVTNLHRTLARHPAALHGLGPLNTYLMGQSMVAAVDQLLMGLRVAWLCRSPLLWATLASEARLMGINEDELQRVTTGPETGWGNWDSTLLRAVDEIYRDSYLSDRSWADFSQRYDAQQLMDVVFTVSEFIMLSMVSNSLGVQPEGTVLDRLPESIEGVGTLTPTTSVRRKELRLVPISQEVWPDEVRAITDFNGADGEMPNFYGVFAQHPRLLHSFFVQSAHVTMGSTLSVRDRDLVILRTGWLCRSEYEWSRHVRVSRQRGLTETEIRNIAIGPGASGWTPFEVTLLRATDELWGENTISDETWNELEMHYSPIQLIDLVISIASTRMVSAAVNSFGVELESGWEAFPVL